MANGDNNFGFNELFPAGLPAAKEGGFKPLFDLPSKQDRVAVASEEKKQSLIEKLGFDQEDTIGQALNFGASFASGASRTLGHLTTLPLDLISGLAQGSVPEEQVQAYNRLQKNEASDTDLALLNQTAPLDDGIPQTYLERLQGTQGIQEVSQKVADFFDVSSIVSNEQRDVLSGDIREAVADGTAQLREAKDAYDEGEYLDAAGRGIKGLGQTVGPALLAGLKNPVATGEYVVENIPQLVAAAYNPALLTASNAGYGYDTYRKGVRDFAEKNDGQLPDADTRATMGLFAASAAAVESVGDIGLIRGLKSAGTAAGTGAARQALSAAKGIGAAGAREGVTEGYQTYAENRAQLKDTTLEDVIEGFTIGALVGGNFHLGAELGGGHKTPSNKPAVEQAFTQAVESGDVSTLTDSDSPAYNPARAVEALHQMNLQDSANVEENLAQVDQIQKDVTADLSSVQARLDNTSPESLAKVEAIIQQMEATGVNQADIQEMREIHEAVSSYTPAQRKADEARVTFLENQLGEIHSAGERMRVDSSPEQAEVESLANDAQTGDKESYDRLLTLTMTNPEAVPVSVAESLAQSESLTEPQRNAMRLFTEAQVAANALKGMSGVSSEIATGGPSFKGISQYRNAVRMALADGNETAARSQVEGIRNFAVSQQSKADALTAAYEQVKGTDNKVALVRNEQGEWGPTDLKGKALKEAGGLEVSARSFKLRDGVVAEADVLAKTADALEALVNAAPTPVAAPVVQPTAEQGEVAAAAPETDVNAATESAPVAPAVKEDAALNPVEEAVQTAEESSNKAESAPANAGQLTTFDGRTGEAVTADNYRNVNLVSELFDQKAGSDTDASVRPLVAVKDFVSAIKAGEVTVQDFLKQEGPLPAPQVIALNAFFNFAQFAEPAVRNQFKVTATRAKRPDFFYRDMAQFLQNADGTIDENLATAVSYGMFSWANENATQLRNSPESINTILMRDLDDEVSNAAYAALSAIGTRESVVASQLGGRIVQALGLQVNQNGTRAEMGKLEASIGERAIAAMVKLGIVTRTQLSDQKLQALMGSTDFDSKLVHNFIAVTSMTDADGKLQPAPIVKRIRERSTGSQSAVAKLFAVEAAGVEPSYTPIPFTQAFAKRTGQEVPSVLAKILDKEGEKAHLVRENMWHVWGKLSKSALYEIGGVVSTTDAPTHVENLASRQAKNDGLIQQVDNFDSFVNAMIADSSTQGLEQPLHFGRSVWKPQRVGLTSNVVNPQTSKIHRHMLAMAEWNADVRLDNKAEMDNFKLRVLEAFGKKTEATTTAKVLQGYDAAVSVPEIQAGVDALVDVLRDNGQINESAIVAGVKAAGEKFHSFDAMVALAEQRIAEQDGHPSFRTAMMGEVDGVTNGPMLSLLMLGAKGFETMNQGGFFELDSPYTQFNDYKAQGNLDLYESNIAGALNRLQGRQVGMLDAMQVITGQLQTAEGNVTSKGRNIIKKPLTALMFGSNTTTAVQGMADGFIEAIYSRIEDAAAKRDNAAISQLFTAVNTLLRSPKNALDVNAGYEVALETRLNAAQQTALKTSFYDLLGKPTEDSLADNYATFIARRNVINQTAQLSFDLFNAVREGVTEFVETNSPDVPRNNAGAAIRTLTKAQQDQVNTIMGDMAPILQTAMSQASGQREAGMYMAKSQKTMDSSAAYEQEVAFGEMVNTIAPDGSMQGIGSTRLSSSRTQDIDPGVMPFITSIHSSDSAIASTVYGQMQALNVHDALGVDLNNVAKVGQELNKATFNTMLDYSSATSMSNMLDEVLAGASKVMQNPALAALIQPKLREKIVAREQKKRGGIAEQLTAIRETAKQADTDKLEMLGNMQAIGQYATDLGSYLVTDADRAKAQTKLGEVGSTFSAAAESVAAQLDAAARIDSAVYVAGKQAELSNASVNTLAPATSLNTLASLEQTPAIAQVIDSMVSGNRTLADALQILPEHQAAEVTQAVAEASGAKLSVWGKLGTPVVQSDVNLVNLLSGTQMTAHNLVDSMVEYVQDPFQKTVLKMAKRGIDSRMPVTYITSETGPEGAFGEGVDKSRGWYAQRNNKAGLFLKSPEFVESGLTPELLSHELVHAALANLIDQHDGAPTVAGRAVAQLENLRLVADEFIANNGALSAKYRNATSNVHELLAWGLTNQDFQKEVLGQVTVAQKDKSILDGLKGFIKSLTEMLFGSNSPSLNNGMANLVANSAVLFKEAAAAQQKRETMTHKYEDAVDHVNAMTSEQVFDSLGAIGNHKSDPAHAAYLKDLLAQTVDPVYGPYGAFKEAASANRAMTPMDVFLKASVTGKLPFSTQATTTQFILSQQEAFVLESVEATISHAMETKETVFVRQGLENLFKEARSKLNSDGRNLHSGDWATASQNEKDIAKAKWDFLFRPQQQITSKNNYLARFAALGLASNEVRNALGFATNNIETPLKGLPITSKLTELFRRAMTVLSRLATKVTPGMAGNAALNTLVEQLVDIEAKRKTRMAAEKIGHFDQLETALAGIGNTVLEKADALGKAGFIRNSKLPFVSGIGAAVSTTAGNRLDAVLDAVTLMRDQQQKSRHGVMMGMLTEWRGVYDSRRLAAELFKGAKANEQERKQMIETTAASVNEAFANQGQGMTQDQRDALTKVFLRTNVQAIAAEKGISGLRDLMEDPKAMGAYRTELENQVVAASKDHLYMISQAKDLAHHKVVGGATSANLMLSVDNIVAMYGTKKRGTPDAALSKALEQLVGVYALQYSGDVDVRNAKEVLRTEMNRTDGNGVEYMLKLHTGLQEKAKNDLFKGTEALQQTGYVAEIHDNKIEVLLVKHADVAAHERAGYVMGTNLQTDPNVSGLQMNGRVLMTRRGAGQTALLTGAMSFTGNTAKGSSPITEAVNMMSGNQATSAAVRQQIAQQKAQAVADLFHRPLSYDPRNAAAGHMAPTLAPDGRIADYRHLMTEQNRDVLLDRDNSMDQVLGVMAGQIADKVSSASQNADVVRSMYDQYRADYTSRPSSYLRVAEDSADKGLAEAFRLLPESTRQEIRKVWKDDAMYVPADQIDMIFGYRKFSLTNAFEAEPADRNVMEKALVGAVTGIFGDKAGLRIGQAEDIMQTMVKEIKDILVIKNIVTLAGNIMSNMTVLAWEGVPLRKAASSHAIAIKGALDYRKDSKRLLQLQQAVEIGYFANNDAANAEILEIQDRLVRNPIKPLVDAGLMPTIVEDVEVDDGRYTYKAQLARKVEKFTDKVPSLLRTLGKQVYMTHDTATYKFLSQTTQLSDLVARYALYEHVTTRRKDPLSKADALRLAEDSFVNYDLPSHRTLQYLNDMGIVMFTKYYLRIQKVIMRLVREKPARGLMLAAIGNMWQGLDSIMDSSWLNRIGNNPLQDGALGYLGALKQLPAIKML